MPDQTLPPDAPIPFPSLDKIERAGRTEAHRQARLLFDAMVESGGRVDIDRLDRLGPDVQQAYIRLLSRGPAAPAIVPAKRPSARNLARRQPPAQLAKRASAKAKPRIDKNWASLRRDLPKAFGTAVVLGFAVSAIGCEIIALILRHFNL